MSLIAMAFILIIYEVRIVNVNCCFVLLVLEFVCFLACDFFFAAWKIIFDWRER